MTIEEQIRELKQIITQGDELALQGYPTGTMNDINRKILAELEEEARCQSGILSH